MKILLALLSLIAGVAAAHAQSQAEPCSQGAKFSLDRGQGKIEIVCARGDTTRGCAEAVLPLTGVLSQDGGPVSGVVYATNSIKCGDTVYEVSTGTKDGYCNAEGPATGPRTGTLCRDGDNKASASCLEGCGPTMGSGSCTIKSAAP
jgi:hypothetical protein